MKSSSCILAALLVLVGAVTLSAGEAALEAVNKRLQELKGEGAAAKLIDPKTTAALPDHTFVAVAYPLFPVVRVPAAPLAQQNLFAVDKEGKLTHLPGLAALEKFFVAKIGDKDHKTAAVAYGNLAEVFFQDGFFKFELDKKSVRETIKTVGKDDLKMVVGQVNVVPEAGNKGYFRFELMLDGKDRIDKIVVDNKVVAGIRPRCQATRLLDADPVIREICERDLLVMGQMARPYLMEQRARATPELQRAIDRVWQRILDEGR